MIFSAEPAWLAGADRYNLRRTLEEHVDPANTHLHTDSANAYVKIGADFIEHSTIDRRAGEYVRGDVSTNQAETSLTSSSARLTGRIITSAASS